MKKSIFLLLAISLACRAFLWGEKKQGVPREQIERLKSASVAEQNQAKQELRTYGFKEVSKAMREFADDPNPEMRILMAETLGQLGGFEAAHSLKELYGKEKNPKVRRALLIQLAGLLPDEKEAFDFFKRVANAEPEEELRYLAMHQLSLLGGSKALRKELNKVYYRVWKRDPFSSNKAIAAVALKEAGEDNPKLWNSLFDALQLPSVEIRRRAARLFGPYLKGSPENSDAFNRISILAQDQDPEVRASISGSLGESGNRAAIPILKSLFMDRDPQVRKSALDGLSHFSVQEVGLPLYLDGLKDTDFSIRSGCIQTLENAGDPSAIGLLESLSKNDPNPQLRTLAKKAVATLSQKEK